MRNFKFSKLLFFLAFLLFNCEHDNLTPRTAIQKLDKVKISSLDKEPYLAELLDKIKFTNNSGGRTNGSGVIINTDSILMILQADSLSYSYTFKVENETTSNSFTNLVFKRVFGGFNAFYVKYEPVNILEADFTKFTGRVTSYNLDRNIIANHYFNNGTIIGNISERTTTCRPSVKITSECAKYEYSWNSQTLECCYRTCVEEVTVITLDYSTCFLLSDGSSGGGSLPSQYTSYTLSNGTFVPFTEWSDGSIPGGPQQPSQPTNPCRSADGGGGLETGTDPNSCSEVIGIIPPSDEEIKSLWASYIDNLIDPEEKRKAQLDYIKTHDGQEGKDFVEMIEQIINTPGISFGEVIDINKIVEKYFRNLRGQYFIAVYYPFAKAAQYIVELVLIETGTTLLFDAAKIALSSRYGINITRVSSAVVKTTQELINTIKAELKFSTNFSSLEIKIGTRTLAGTPNGVKSTFSFSSVSRAEAKSFFDKLSLGANKKIVQGSSGEIIVADLGNGQYVRYRTWSTSNLGETTIEFNIIDIRSGATTELKFFN